MSRLVMSQQQDSDMSSALLNFDDYLTEEMYDEMFEKDNVTRPHYQALKGLLESLEKDEFENMRNSADQSLLRQGITFTVYDDVEGTEKSSRLI